MMIIPMRARFVIQNHDAPQGRHFDLMLESGDALATWRIGRLPGDLAGGECIPATHLGSHRLAYLTYEGEVSGGRGAVAVVDAGTYRTLSRTEGAWTVELAGRKTKGTFELKCVDADRWEMGKVGSRS